jgi:hypothetical protein
MPRLSHAAIITFWSVLSILGTSDFLFANDRPNLNPVVEVEETVYRFTSPDNGSGPIWCHGSTCLVRMGEEVFATSQELIPDAKRLSNTRWNLYQRASEGWKVKYQDTDHRTREPSPIAAWPKSNRLFVSTNAVTDPNKPIYGPTDPAIVEFDVQKPAKPISVFRPSWQGNPPFNDHSYRSFAADSAREELLLMHNIGYTHSNWALLDSEGQTVRAGQLKWPLAVYNGKTVPLRLCYPNVALKNRAVYFCGGGDIREPNEAWQKAKFEKTGRSWDYVFRRLFFSWTPDIAQKRFVPWVEIRSLDEMAGNLFPCDLYVGPDGRVHILWRENKLDLRIRDQFFPNALQVYRLAYAVVKDGKVIERRTLHESIEGKSALEVGDARFHINPDGRLLAVYYVFGTDSNGNAIHENRLTEITTEGNSSPVTIPFEFPFRRFFTATVRAGSTVSDTIDLLGIRKDKSGEVGYAAVKLQGAQDQERSKK